MRRLLTCILFVFVITCSTKSEVVLKDTDYLKYGTRASVIEKVWGKPDETMAFQDYRAKGNFYHSGVGGSWGPYGGSVSGYSFGGTYTPTTIVWIYKEKGMALFFQKRGLLDEPHTAIMIWKLVGWENLTSDQTTKPQVTPPEKPVTSTPVTPSMSTEKTVTWTFANIRSGAGDNYPVVTTVKQGDKLTVIGESGEWFNVRVDNGQQGWVSNKVVK